MKIATFKYLGSRHVGVVNAKLQTVQPFKLSKHLAESGGIKILKILASGFVMPVLGDAIPMADIELEAPIPIPLRNIFCAGKNYIDHVQEVANSNLGSGPTSTNGAPLYPIIFSKVSQSVIGTHQKILSHANLTQQLDYEAELAVIIGKAGTSISREKAMDYVWGYTIINDVSARDLQKKHQQWLLAKSLDTFCPMGPWMVSKDEFDVTNAHINCWVNGELRQSANTNQMIFDIPQLIETISAGITLYPGDIIATGTPSGVGMGFTPPKFLKSGDEVKISISGIGELINQVQD